MEELPSKSQCKMLSETLDKNNMDHTQYLPFVSEDFDNLASRSLEDRSEPILERMAADFKKLLISPIPIFWSTCAYNSYLQKSLDSFLKYGKKLRFSKYSIRQQLLLPKKSFSEDQYLRKNHSYLEWMQEIFRLVFSLYSRLGRYGAKLNQQELDLNTGKVIFEGWLFDSVKALDLIAIYSFENLNKEGLKTLIRGFYELNKEYYEDFLTTLGCIMKILGKNVKEIVDIKKREKLLGGDTKIGPEEIETRYMIIVTLLDISYIFNDIMNYFPMKCQENLFLDPEAMLLAENLYYEIDGLRSFLKPEDFKQEALPLIAQILTNLCGFFKSIFGFIIEGVASKYITENNGKNFQTKIETFLMNLGKMAYGGKKDPINLGLMRHLLRNGFDLQGFFDKMPSFIKIGQNNEPDKEKIQILLVSFESLKEEFKNENVEDIEEDESNDEKNEEKEAKLHEKKEDDKEKEKKEEKQEEQIKEEKKEIEKIKVTEVIIGKKERKNLDVMSEKEQKETAAFIKAQMQSDIYEDEYDDTFEIFNEGRIVVEKNQLDPDEEEEYQINENPNQYEDERNDDFVRSYEGSRNEDPRSYKTEYVPKNNYHNNKEIVEEGKQEATNWRNQKKDFSKGYTYDSKNDFNPQQKANYNKEYREKDITYQEKKGGNSYYKEKEGSYREKEGSYKEKEGSYKEKEGFYRDKEGAYKENRPKEGGYYKEKKEDYKERDRDGGYYHKETKEKGGGKQQDNREKKEEKGGFRKQENKEKIEEVEIIQEGGPTLAKNQSSATSGGHSGYSHNKRKYQQDKDFKNKASYKRKF